MAVTSNHRTEGEELHAGIHGDPDTASSSDDEDDPGGLEPTSELGDDDDDDDDDDYLDRGHIDTRLRRRDTRLGLPKNKGESGMRVALVVLCATISLLALGMKVARKLGYKAIPGMASTVAPRTPRIKGETRRTVGHEASPLAADVIDDAPLASGFPQDAPLAAGYLFEGTDI